MKILKSSLETREIVNQSIRKFLREADDYCYVYLHKINDIVFYVGMGSHDRAVRVMGRSNLWYKTAILEKVTVEIINHSLTREQGLIIEQELIKKYSDTVINYQYDNLHTIPVIQFDRKGNKIREYNSVSETEDSGFYPNCVDQCCQGQRGLHNNFVWMYKDDYDKRGFQMKSAPTHPKTVQQVDLQGKIIRTLNTASEFVEFGFKVKNIQQVCKGKKKSHGGFIFKYIDE